MRPLASRGRWSGREPFGDPPPQPCTGPVAAITRARLRGSRALTFWRAVPPVSARLATAPGLRVALGIGEAPVGLQGTFSMWDDADALQAFAYGTPEHADAVRRTPQVGWYREELSPASRCSPRPVRSAASPSHRSPRLTPVPSQPVLRHAPHGEVPRSDVPHGDVPRTCA